MADSRLNIIINGQDRASGALNSVSGSLERLASNGLRNLQSVGAVALGGLAAGATALTAAAGGAAVALGHMAIQAAPVANLASSFESIAADMEGGSDAMLSAMQDATGGMIPMRDLMTSFNKAAQLVGRDFAEQLPSAMGYLGRVAAATGQDVGFLMDSLVTGVGRLSPMILDNLGITVDLTAAYEDYATELGISTDEMTKQQQQAALMAQVMERLEGNVGDLADPANSAAGQMARFQATIQDTKDRIGMALLPVLSDLMGTLGVVVDRVLPPVLDAFENKLVPFLSKAATAVSEFVQGVAYGLSPLESLRATLQNFGMDQLATTFQTIADGVTTFIAKAQDALAPIVAFVSENVKLQDVLIAVGIAIASVVVPALASAIATAAPVIAAFVAIVAVVALLRKAWESDFLGIKTALTAFWEGSAKPALSQLAAWLGENVPKAIAAVTQWFTGTFLPAVNRVWSFIQTNLIPLFQALGDLLGTVLSVAVTALAGIWQNVLHPALTLVWNMVKSRLQPVFEAVSNFISTHVSPRFNELSERIGGVAGAIQTVIGWIDNLKEKLANIQLPDWMTPGSPTPWEIGLRGVSDAMSQLARGPMVSLNSRLNQTGQNQPSFATASPVAASGGMSGGGGQTIMPIYIGGQQVEELVIDGWVRGVRRRGGDVSAITGGAIRA